jgi:hypothetical protein
MVVGVFSGGVSFEALFSSIVGGVCCGALGVLLKKVLIKKTDPRITTITSIIIHNQGIFFLVGCTVAIAFGDSVGLVAADAAEVVGGLV